MHGRIPGRWIAPAGALLLLAVGLAGAAAAATPELDAALARAAAENKPLVIDFYTDW